MTRELRVMSQVGVAKGGGEEGAGYRGPITAVIQLRL